MELTKIYATVDLGGASATTPYVQSFTINKSRGQPSTFSASIKVRSSSSPGGVCRIYSSGTLIYTGIVKKVSCSPCWDSPGYVIMNVSGSDILSLLQGKKYTRRIKAARGSWVSINNVVRPRFETGKFEPVVGTLYTGGSPGFSGGSTPNSSRSIIAHLPKVSTSPNNISTIVEIEEQFEEENTDDE